MKTKRLIPMFILTSLVLSCNLTLPESVKFKTKANYNFTVAKLNMELADYFDPATLIPTDESSPFKIYDYNPPSNTKGIQQYAIKVPIQEIPLDMSAFLGSTDFGDLLDSISFNKEFEVPNIDVSGEENLDTDGISAIINSSFQILSEGGSDEVEVTTEGSTFSNLTYETGNFVVIFDSSVSGSVSLLKQDRSLISKSPVLNSAKQFVIPLDGKTIPHDAIIYLEVDDLTIPFKAGMDPASICKKVIGLTITDYSEFPPIELSESLDASDLGSVVSSIIFGEGCNFRLIEKYPSDWSGLSIEYTAKLTGGINKTLTNLDTSLENVVFTPGNVDVAISLVPRINNATIVFGKQPTLGYKLEAKKLKKVEINAGELPTDFSINEALPAGASDMLKQIAWKKGSGIKITYTNSFPEGNDFTLSNVKSDFIGIPLTSKTLQSASKNQIVSIVTETDTTTNLTPSTKIDFSGKLVLPGTDDKLVISNIETGKKYSVDINIQPVLDWKSITLDSSVTSVKTQFGIDFNKADIFKDIDAQLGTTIGTDLEIDAIPVHLYCEIPDLDSYFTNPKFHGNIAAFVGTEQADTLVPSNSEKILKLLDNADMPLEKAPVLKFNDKKTLISNISGGLTADLASLINDSKEGEKICIDCDVEFNTGTTGEIVIEKDKISSIGATSISLTAMIELPLAVRIKHEQKIDILEKFGPESSDLFGRTEEPNYNGIDEILSLVKYAEVSFWPEKKLFISDNPISLNVDIDGTGSEYDVQKINLNGGAFRLEDPRTALKIYPIMPSVDLTIPEGYLAIPRDIALIAPVRITVQTDGEISLLEQGADHD